MTGKWKKRILIIAMLLVSLHFIMLNLTGLDGCITERHKLKLQGVIEDELCQTPSGKCLFIWTDKKLVGCGCGLGRWSKDHSYYFASETEELNASSGDMINVRWCDIKIGSPVVDRKIRGVWKVNK